jgi:hypothetical protein
MTVKQNVEIDFDTNVPLISISNTPGRYVAKISTNVESINLCTDFYLEFENESNTWNASNACIFCIRGGEWCDIDTIKRVTSGDKLQFFLSLRNCTSNRANVNVTVLGSHADNVISIETVPKEVECVNYDDGYRDNGWYYEIGRIEYYQDIFDSIT